VYRVGMTVWAANGLPADQWQIDPPGDHDHRLPGSMFESERGSREQSPETGPPMFFLVDPAAIEANRVSCPENLMPMITPGSQALRKTEAEEWKCSIIPSCRRSIAEPAERNTQFAKRLLPVVRPPSPSGNRVARQRQWARMNGRFPRSSVGETLRVLLERRQGRMPHIELEQSPWIWENDCLGHK